MVVEDEFLIRENAVEMVRSAGCDVVEAGNADEAIDVLQNRFDIAVIFTDIEMPGSMDGRKLAAVVRNRWPPIKIITASGRMRLGEDELPSGSRFLPKPYSGPEVAVHLRDLAGFEPGAPGA